MRPEIGSNAFKDAASMSNASMPPMATFALPSELNVPILPLGSATSCLQHVRISIFFDGTGNNRDADSPDMGHSNVARLYRAHPDDDNGARNVYKIYVPGIGTYFRDINDKGGGGLDGGTFGNAFGSEGEARIQWALDRVKEQLMKCDVRAYRSPSAKVVEIKLAVFGFSRGAAAARAFCRDFAKVCVGGKFKLANSGLVPIELDFLGLFDTVASVGLPTSANTKLNRVEALIGTPTQVIMNLTKALLAEDPLAVQAFGARGAQPSQGANDGHYDWAKDMSIGPMVQHCLHLVAGHEFRNSFPLDSALQGGSYPAAVQEMCLPGSHSDIGGGYEPSEGGKCRPFGSLLSNASLWLMYNEAGRYVPFFSTSKFAEYSKQDFGMDDRGQPGRQALWQTYQSYLSKLPAADDLGKSMLAHKRLYYAWRFRAIARSPAYSQSRLRAARDKSGATTARVKELEDARALHRARGWPWPDTAESELQMQRRQMDFDKGDVFQAEDDCKASESDGSDARQAEEGFKGPRAALYDDAEHKRLVLWRAQMEVDELAMRKANFRESGIKWPESQEASLEAKRNDLPRAEDAYLTAKARFDTKADDSQLLAHIVEYNRQLMEDAVKLDTWAKERPSQKMRPHYQAILDAYRNEFQLGKGLRDPAVVEFFNHYVHDSLAAFHHDDTRTSDPRVIYVGGDERAYYAMQGTPEAQNA